MGRRWGMFVGLIGLLRLVHRTWLSYSLSVIIVIPQLCGPFGRNKWQGIYQEPNPNNTEYLYHFEER